MYNIKQGKSSSFDPIPDDRYSLKVTSAEVTPHTKNNEDGHRFNVAFVITDGPFKGRKVWDNIYLPWVTWKMYALLEAGGSTVINSENATPEAIGKALEGLEVSAYVSTSIGTNDNVRTNLAHYKKISADVDEDTSFDVSRLK